MVRIINLQIKGHPFQISSNDTPKVCVWKALAALPEGDFANRYQIADSLNDGHYSRSMIMAAICRMSDDLGKKKRKNTFTNRVFYVYYLKKGFPMPEESWHVPAMTKKNLAERAKEKTA